MIKADIHMHTSFSTDSKEPMENMVNTAIDRGFDTICITEHLDLDFPICEDSPEGSFLVDTDAYYKKYCELREKYSSPNTRNIRLLFGVEIGLQPHLGAQHEEYVRKYPFDFVIGSEHTTCRKDPYYPEFYEGRSEFEAYSEYFEDMVANLKAYSGFDALGHMDYVLRYGPNKNRDFTYNKYADYLDEILKILVSKGIGLEINSSGYKYGLGYPNPCKDIILRYREFGGEIITIGSDAHDVSRIGLDFDKVEQLAKDCGFNHYCVFQERKPQFIKF